ncbi:MAG: CBS domain-containing protein [Oscillochloris sp.]|nr:CBS domain-containing protein [Oscillochloris sp.]
MAGDQIQRVRIYLQSNDRWENRTLYQALLDELQRSGATGATALSGLAGFGPRRRLRPLANAAADQVPVVIEWIDHSERIERLLPLIDAMLDDALVTREDVQVHRAVLRARGPFAADRTVGDVMRPAPPTVSAEQPLSAALAVMTSQQLGALPIVDDAGNLIGLLTTRDLAWRAGLRLDFATLDLLTPGERDPILTPLIGRVVRDVMSSDPRSVLVDTTIAEALVTMIEWGYSHVPVVDRSERLVGALGAAEVLQAAVEQVSAANQAVRDAEQPATVRLVMGAAPISVALGQPLALALAALLADREHRVLVVDADGKLIGQISAHHALSNLSGDERARLLAALQREEPTPLAGLPGSDRPLDHMVEAPPPGLAPELPILDAARRLLELGVERAPVLSTEQRLLGIITRGGLVRALMQQSE